jgi:hypothetical protein
VSTFYDFPLKGSTVQKTEAVTNADDFDGWAFWDGTSFAAPVVAAAVAAEMTNGGGSAREAAARLIHAAAGTLQPGIGVLIAPTDYSV